MFNLNTFAFHLNELQDYISHLKELKKYSKKELLNEWQIYGLAERYLHLAIECALSLGEQLISNYGYRLPGNYRDIANVLEENKVISKTLAKALSDMAGFRNILVHGYAKIDRSIVYKHLHNDVPKLNSYVKRLSKILKLQ